MFFHPILNESVVKIIESLRKKGHRVVCGTNTIESHYDNHLSRGDYAFFDQTYTSVSMGVSKPDCDFWNKILLAEGFSSDECFFVDDKIENCEAAASLGITVFNLANFNQIKEFKKSIKLFLKNHKK
jgi:putative hydrolase of the HAD superfamily